MIARIAPDVRVNDITHHVPPADVARLLAWFARGILVLGTALLGAGLLWFGWFGFNGGSGFSTGDASILAFVNTLLTPAARGWP